MYSQNYIDGETQNKIVVIYITFKYIGNVYHICVPYLFGHFQMKCIADNLLIPAQFKYHVIPLGCSEYRSMDCCPYVCVRLLYSGTFLCGVLELHFCGQ